MCKMINKDLWLDNNGRHINAHGGGIMEHKGVFYWYGEHKGPGVDGKLAYQGVHMYYSENLQDWNDGGIVLKVNDTPNHPIHSGCRIERPKVIFCEKTGKFVMYFHSSNLAHAIAKRGLAIADTPAGPFEFISAERPNAAVWPLNAAETDKEHLLFPVSQKTNDAENDTVKKLPLYVRDFSAGQMARDMNLFKDDDGKAYHIYASEQNSTLHIAELSDDYLYWTGRYVRVLPHRWNEGEAIFRRNGRYYLLASGCTSWAPNAARSAVADSIMGEYTELGNPCRGIGAEITFGGQSSAVFKAGDTYVAMFDLWNAQDFIDSRYFWLPIKFTENGYEIHYQREFKL
ncbi:MAG: beta-glucanase [Lentisphaerae bacterium]|nr:beta-glucanase [Lentisphaerota bacterium]